MLNPTTCPTSSSAPPCSGWFGFHTAGSGLAANGQGVNAFLVTNTAAAAAPSRGA